MGHASRQTVYDRVLVDLNTQCDFLLPRGAVPVANRQAVLPNIRRLMSWARLERIPVLSTIDAHRPCERNNGLPPYCVDRSPGQRKISFTLLPRRVVIPGDNTLDLPFEAFRRYRQVIFTKRTSDFLSNPKADRLINMTKSTHLVLFGVITENCVKAAALALMARQRRVAVVIDACGHWNAADAELALLQMEAKGAVLLTTEQLLSGSVDEQLRAPFPVPRQVDADLSQPAHGDGNGRSAAQDATQEPARLRDAAAAGCGESDSKSAAPKPESGSNGNGRRLVRPTRTPLPKTNNGNGRTTGNGADRERKTAPAPRARRSPVRAKGRPK